MYNYYWRKATRSGYFFFGLTFSPLIPYWWGLGLMLTVGGLDLLVGPLKLESGWMPYLEPEVPRG